MLSAAETARAVLAVAGPGLAVSAARDLRQAREFARDGVLSWAVVGTNANRRLAAVADGLMVWERYRVAVALQFTAGVAAPAAAAAPGPGAAVVSWLLLTTVLLSLHRGAYGTDGADQMSALAVLCAAVTLTVGGATGRLFLAFLTCQLLLSYLIAGVAKLVSPVWRDGSCLAQILSTHAYGSPRLAALLRSHPLLALLLSWGVMVLEVTFFCALFLPSGPMEALLAAGVLLHLGIAVAMGLTTFVFAFVSAYPALVFTAATWTGW
ncbi:hypothetical protein [Streptomyces sp. XH2]|uniref:hypothetical protein n=1 Tax=Streptomyces sp. XH2 TaxID=3412483 RepID=UPI003C7D05C4